MAFRNLATAMAAATLALTPVAVQAGTTASSVATVGARSSAGVADANRLAEEGSPVLLYLLGAITFGALIALLAGGSGGSRQCQSLGVTVNCN